MAIKPRLGNLLAAVATSSDIFDTLDAPADIFDEVESGGDIFDQVETPSVGIGERLRQIPAAIGEAAATAVAGTSRIAEQFPINRLATAAREAISGETVQPLSEQAAAFAETVRPEYGVTEGASQDLMGKVIDGAGSLVAAIGSGPAAPLTMAGMMGETALQEARDAGATGDQQAKAFIANAGIGLISEALLGAPALIRSAMGKGGGQAFESIKAKIAAEIGKGFLREGSQEVIEQVASDATARYIAAYDKDRNIFDPKKLIETFLVGGLVGAGAGGVVGAAGAIDQKNEAREYLKTVPDEVLRMGAEDPDFRKSAPYDPTLIDEELVRRGTDNIQRTQKITVEEPEPEMVPVTPDPDAPIVTPPTEESVTGTGTPIEIPIEEPAKGPAPETTPAPEPIAPEEVAPASQPATVPAIDQNTAISAGRDLARVAGGGKLTESQEDGLASLGLLEVKTTPEGTREVSITDEGMKLVPVESRATNLAKANNTRFDGFDELTGKYQFTLLDKGKETTFYLGEDAITEEGLRSKVEFKRAEMSAPTIDTPEKLNEFLASLTKASAKTGAESAQPSIAERAAPTGRVEALERSLAEKQADLNAARALGDADGEGTARQEIAVISRALKIAKMSDAEAAANTEARATAKQELRARPKIKLKKKDAGGIPLNVIEDMFPTVIKIGRGIFEKTKDFARWTGEMVRALGGAVRPYLKAIFDSLSGANIRPQFRESGAVGGVGRRPTPEPGAPVLGAREGEHQTRTAARDTGTLGQKAWEAIRKKTTVPDSFGEDIDFAYAKINELGDLQAAYQYARSGGTPMDGMTERRQIATLFAVQSEASEARKAAEQAGNTEEARRLGRLEEDAAMAFGDLATQGGKNLNIIGQLYSAMPLTPEGRVRIDERRLAQSTGGGAAHNASEEAVRRIKDAERLAAREAAKEAAKQATENAIKQSQSIPARERAAAVKMLQKLITGKDVPAEAKPALEEYFNRVRRDLRAALNAKTKGPSAKITDDQIIAKSLAEMQEDRYAEAVGIWERALGELISESSPEQAELLHQYVQEGVPDLFMQNAAKVVAAEISRNSIEVAQIAERSLADRKGFTAKFAADLVARFPDLSPQQAERFAAAFQKSFTQRVEGHARKTLESMLKAGSGPARAKRQNTMNKMFRLYRLGALDDATTSRLFSEEAGAEEFTPEFRKKLLGMYEEAEKLPEGISRNQKMSEIAWEIAMANPKYNWWDYATAISYGNILGAASTILANNPLGGLQSTLEGVILLPLTNKGARWQSMKGALRTWASHFGESIALANEIMRSGENYQNVHQFDGTLNQNPMEYLDRLARQPDIGKTKKAFARAGAQYRWISRMIMYPDALLRWPAKHAIEFSLAARMLKEKGFKGNKLWDAVDATLYPGGREAALAEAKKQVAEEVKAGQLTNKAQQVIRQRELVTAKLSGDAQEVVNSSDELANYAGLLNDPAPDMLGFIHDKLIEIASAPKPDKSLTGLDASKAQARYAVGVALSPFLRFIRVAVNGTRLLLDYGVGLGAIRHAMRFSPLIEGPAGVAQAQQRAMRAYIGLAFYSALTLYFASVDDDDDPWFDLIGTGPDDWRERKRLRDSHVTFNSIKVGNNYIRFSNMPIAMILGAFARYRDNKKWPKGERTDANAREMEPLMEAALSGMRDSLTSMSFSRGLGDFLSIINGKDNAFGQSPSQMLGNVAAAYIPGNFRGLSQFDEILSGPKERADGFIGALSNGIAFYAPNGRGLTILGDEIPSTKGMAQRAAEKTFNFSTLADDTTLRFVLNTGIAIPTIGAVRDSRGRRLNHKQFSTYMQRSGARLRSVLERGGMERLMIYPEQEQRNGRTIHPRRDVLNRAYKEIRDEVLSVMEEEN